MSNLSKQQKIALAVVGVLILVCFIGGMMALNSGSKDEAAKDTGKTKQEQTADTEAGAKSVADMIVELTPMLGLEKTSSLDLEKIAYYYGVSATSIAECGGVIGDVALADELVIMKAADSDKVAELEAGANKRMNDQKQSFQDYIPEQFKRMDNAQVVVVGDYVAFVCADDTDGIVAKLKELVGE